MLLDLLKGNISQEEYFRNNNIKLIFKRIPKKIYGFVFNYKGNNLVVVNVSVSLTKAKGTILHELAHIELNHIHKRKRLLEFKIDGLEDEADGYVKELLEEINEEMSYE